jgi:uncharacterized protein YegJ (DUF2314 family)
MWVEVVSWRGKKLHGLLDSDPQDVADLQSGAPVDVDEDAIFDFIVKHRDGSMEGGETNRILEARAGGAAKR